VYHRTRLRARALPTVLVLLAACGDRATDPGSTAQTCAAERKLSRGQVQLISGAATLDCVVVGSAADTSEYVLVTANASATQDEVQSYLVKGEAAASARLSASAPSSSEFEASDIFAPVMDSLTFAVSSEARRREAMRGVLAGRSPAALLAGRRQVRTPAALAVAGDTISLRVGDATASNMCATFSNVRAVVRGVGARAIVAQDIAAPANGFSDADFAAITREFDTLVHPTVVRWFGEVPDINADGKVVLLFTPAINRLTPPGSLGFVGGYFWSADLLPRSLPAQNYSCPASNEQEIMYFLTPDPNGQVNGNRFTVPSVYKAVRGTIAHELQHLINQGRRQVSGAPAETDWMNEGLSHLAEEMVGRAARNYAVSRALTYEDVLVDLDDFDSFFRQNLIRFRGWMTRPDLSSPISRRAVSELAPRGAAWALLRYALDQYGGADPTAFTRALVVGPQVDVANLEARARTNFNDMITGFLVASAVDPTAGVASRYRFLSWNIRSAMAGINATIYPLRVTTFPALVATQSMAGSGNFFSLKLSPASAPFTARMQGTDGAPVNFAGARALLIRTR